MGSIKIATLNFFFSRFRCLRVICIYLTMGHQLLRNKFLIVFSSFLITLYYSKYTNTKITEYRSVVKIILATKYTKNLLFFSLHYS
jgi:hypothetical protein